MRLRFAKLIPAAALLVGMAIQVNSAQAGFQVQITDVGTSTTHTYNYAGATVLGNPAIFISDIVGHFAVTLELVTSNFPGSPTLAFLDKNGSSISNLSASTDTIQIVATATDYTSPTAPPPLDFIDTTSGTLTQGTISGATDTGYIGLNNQMYANVTGPAITGPAAIQTGTSSTSFSASNTDRVNTLGSPYSLTNVLRGTFSGHATATSFAGATKLQATPEPGTIAMACTALPMLGLVYRRRRRTLAG